MITFQKLDHEKYNKYLDKVRNTDFLYSQISFQLDTIFDKDQDIREYYYTELGKGKDKNSPEMKAIIDCMTIVDSRNFAVVNKLIEKYCFLGTSMKTVKSRNTMFAVIQYSSTEAKDSLFG